MFETFGFEIVEERAGGAGARSFLARVQGSEELALVTLARTPERAHASERLARAITRLAELDLPSLVPARIAGCVEDGRPFVVSRYREGETLAAALERRGPLSPDELVLVAIPLCGALAAMRSQGVLVRRLFPEQVILLGGFGQLTPALIGSPLFAEELEPGSPVNARADVEAIGLLMQRALEDPRVEGPEGLKATVSVDPIDKPLREVIDRCLSEDPAVAFTSPAEVARALAERQPSTFINRSLPGNDVPSPQAPRAELEHEGDVLGNYVLEALLGEGAMGRVFLARHITLGRQAAVKVLRPEHAQNPALVQRFFQEAKAVNQINHEHIVEIYDFAEEHLPDGRRRAYCVLELLSGHSLTEVLAQGPLPVQRAVHIAQQVCRALQAAHQVGVVHRDIKPDNLHLTQRGGTVDFVKVLDFGVAKLDALRDAKASETAEGTIVGTPTYMAPEQAAGLPTDPRTDVYAVATVLYEMLAGHTPFTGANFGQLASQVISHAPPPLPRYTRGGEKIPASLRALVLSCLEKDPQRRPSSMAELEAQLQPYLAPAEPPRLSRRTLAPASAMLGLLLVVAVLRLTRAHPAEAAPANPQVALGEVAEIAPPRLPVPIAPAVRSAIPHQPTAADAAVITVRSKPSGAKVVRVDTGEPLGMTPLSLLLGQGEQVRVRLTLPGRVAAERTVSARGKRSLEVGLARERKRFHRPVEARRGGVDPFAL